MHGKSKYNKVSLAYAGNTGIWLAEQLGKDSVTVSKWCKNTTQPDFTETGKDFGIAKD